MNEVYYWAKVKKGIVLVVQNRYMENLYSECTGYYPECYNIDEGEIELLKKVVYEEA